MSTDLRSLTTELRLLIGQLKNRCTEAEKREAELRQQVQEQQMTIGQLEQQLTELNTRYNNLRTGLCATGSRPEQVAELREQYLAMVSEIDACIAKLQ